MPTQFEPRKHTTLSGLTTEAGERAKSGFFGGVRAGVLGTLLGAGLIGMGLGFAAYSAALMPFAATVAPFAEVIGVGAAVAGAFVSLTPLGLGLPYLFGSAMALIGGTLGLYSGADRGVARVEGERMAAMRDREGAAQTAMVRDMAQMRAMQATARLGAAQDFIEQQVTVRTAAVTPPEAATVVAETDKPKNPLIQAEGTKIDAATVAKMGLASMPVQEMAKA